MKLVARPDRDHSVKAIVYSYSGLAYANPDAPTQIANGVSTTTYSYDNDGNLTSAVSWDYNNRMTQAVTQGSTSTYAYDYAGNRVSQVVGNTTTIYPNKYYSITSTTNGATTNATTTVYVWNGDTLRPGDGEWRKQRDVDDALDSPRPPRVNQHRVGRERKRRGQPRVLSIWRDAPQSTDIPDQCAAAVHRVVQRWQLAQLSQRALLRQQSRAFPGRCQRGFLYGSLENIGRIHNFCCIKAA
jgi:YD repeat-containing protein